jgi:hypothetical protein
MTEPMFGVKSYPIPPKGANPQRIVIRFGIAYAVLAFVILKRYGSLGVAPLWLWLTPFVIVFLLELGDWVLELTDMVWKNFERLHERLDAIESRIEQVVDQASRNVPR